MGLPQAVRFSMVGPVCLGGEGGEPVGAGVGEVAADEDEVDPGGVGEADVFVGVVVVAFEDE